MLFWNRTLWILLTARKTNKWDVEQIKPELSLETEMTTLRPFYFQHTMGKQDSLERTVTLGNVARK